MAGHGRENAERREDERSIGYGFNRTNTAAVGTVNAQ
jgi:hypothetical protein